MDSKDFFMEKSWARVLGEEFEKEYMKNLQKFLISEIESNQIIYPPKDLIFNAFCKTPYDK
nr:Uracil-DNA glycosylase [Candidatus Anoxychlamydiales bacterium]